jgi:endonuclease-3
MTRQERYTFLLDYFEQRQPEVTTELNFGSAFQLIVATLLSAQCTDERINKVTPALFAKYPDAHAMAQATEEDLLEYIRSVSYPNSKAKHLVAMARMIERDFRGEIPDNTADLVKLPGVGRKTANVLQAVWFNKPTLAVDTHVYRVSHRLGLVPKTANTPLKVEKYLMKHIPEEKITRAHHWLLLHGRYVCNSARPKCEKCDFESFCPKLLEGSKVAKG